MIGLKQTALVVLLATGMGFTGTSQADLLYNITDFGMLGGYGLGINDSGQVTGTNSSTHAFITNSSGQMIDLGTLGGAYSYGRGINGSGQVIGDAITANGSTHAFITNSSGQMIDLGTLGGNHSEGRSINASGQVTGSSATKGTWDHAFVTNSSGQMIDLGALGGRSSYGLGINDSGQVTGYYLTANYGAYRAFATDSSGQMIDLGTLGGSSYGWGINSSGQVVGNSILANGREHAFVTDNGIMRDLNSLLASNATGWELWDAYGINNAGQIAASGFYNGDQHAFLLTPISSVPTPGAVWLFGSGLIGLLSFNRRKNKIANVIAA
jgi:probable HAF family extracellular repeat protein